MKPLVIVLSRNYSTGLGVIRSLGAAGYTVDLIASVKKRGSSIIASKSKYVRNVVEVVTTKIQGDAGKEILDVLWEYTKKYDDKMILFPTDDFTTTIVDSNRHSLKKHFLFSTVIEENGYSICSIMDKFTQGQIAKKVGLTIAEERIISLKGTVEIPKDIEYPCFVKPLQSVSGNKNEMTVCNNERQLQEHLQILKSNYKDRDILIQKYLKIDKEFDLSGVCLKDKIIVPAVIEKIRVAKHELGVTMTGTMVPIDVLGEAREKLLRMFEEFKYIGMFDVELFLCNGEIYFNEINFRSGGPNYAYFLNGVNLPAIFVNGISGDNDFDGKEEITSYGKTFIYEKVAWEDYINSYITKKELKQYIKNTDYRLLDDKNDPAPGKCFNRRIRLSALKNRLTQIPKRQNVNVKGKIEMTNNIIPPVVVVGRNYCNILTMTRALGESGYRVEILRVFKKKPSPINILGKMKPDAYSKYVEKYQECIVCENPKLIIEELMKATGRKRLLIPVDDYSVEIIDQSLDLLRDKYIVSNIGGRINGISCLMDKNKQKEEAEKVELPILKSELVRSVNGTFDIPENLKYPCFVKPNKSANSTKAQMKKCCDRDELAVFLKQMASKGDFEMLVEEFAEICAEYSILGVAKNNVAIAPCVFKVIEGGHKERKGVTLIGKTVGTEKYQNMIDQCLKYVKHLDYEGIFDIDLIETKDNNIYFIEINFRAGASTHVFTKSGVNLPGIYADAVLKGKKIDTEIRVYDTGKYFVSEKILLEEFTRRDVSLKSVFRYMRNADVHFIKDKNDPRPYSYFRYFYIVALIMRIPYRIRDYLKK